MRKVILILAVMLFSIASRASLTIHNYTCGTVDVYVLFHDATYSTCGYIETQKITLSANTSVTLTDVSATYTGVCYLGGSGTPTYSSTSTTQTWDGFLFEANDGTNITKGEADYCGGPTSGDAGPSCDGDLDYSITTSGSNTTIWIAST